MERLPNSRGCIICGKENPVGLKLHFLRTEDGAQTTVRVPEHFQGFDGVVQGGVVAGLMDDAMWYSILSASGGITMTVELTVRYKAPVPIDTDLTVTGKVVEQRRMLHTCSAVMTGPDGKVLAEAAGKFMPAPKALLDNLQSGLS